MDRAVYCLLFCLVVSLVAANICAADYLENLEEAVTSVEVGVYDRAAVATQKALAINDLDPLGHLALGTVYLHAGQCRQAAEEYMRVTAIRPEEWRAYYALALLGLLEGDKSAVDKNLAAARKLAPASSDIATLDLYIKYLQRDISAVEPDVVSTSPLAHQITAMAAVETDDRVVVETLRRVLSSPTPPGFEENRAPIATFDRTRPVALPQGELGRKAVEDDDAPVLSGTVLLKADATRAAGVEFVIVYVDDEFVGVTNCSPLEFHWDTRNHPNGLHRVRIEGQGSLGNVVSEKSIRVRLANSNPKRSPSYAGPEVDKLRDRLWDCIRLSECRKLAHYYLAKLCLASRDTEMAIRHLEYTVAYQPDFRDSHKVLSRLRKGRAEYRELRRGSDSSKKLALTFDDGPNEWTAELLEVLAKLGVRATFFLVGFRAESQPELVRAIQAGGHQIENHSYTHPNLAKLPPLQVEQELCKTIAVIRSITGRPSLFFRPPGGHTNKTVERAAGKQGLTGVFWSFNCTPYERSGYAVLADHVIRNACNGGIILMHNGEPAAMALPAVIEELRKQGYEFVTVSELVDSQ